MAANPFTKRKVAVPENPVVLNPLALQRKTPKPPSIEMDGNGDYLDFIKVGVSFVIYPRLNFVGSHPHYRYEVV